MKTNTGMFYTTGGGGGHPYGAQEQLMPFTSATGFFSPIVTAVNLILNAESRPLLAAGGNKSLTIVAALDNSVDGHGTVVRTCVNKLIVTNVNAAVRNRSATLHRKI